jgi:hypothetical protein
MGDEDVTREVDWDEADHIAPGTVRVRSAGLAYEILSHGWDTKMHCTVPQWVH